MACNPIAMRDGAGNLVATGFACGPRKRTKPCVGCGGASELLCDYPLAGAKAGKTCDASICRRCATKAGPLTDLCPPHARLREKEAASWLDTVMAVDAAADGLRAYADQVVAEVAALPVDSDVPPWERDDVDLNAVDRGALSGMFPQWPDVATTHDERLTSARTDEVHGEVGALRVTGNADAWWGAPHGEVGTSLEVAASRNTPLGERAREVVAAEFGVDIDSVPPWSRIKEAAPAETNRSRNDRPSRGAGDDFADAFAAAASVDRELAAHAQSLAEKVGHVKRAGQTRGHACHWTGCERQCPPAMWGCREHWYALPKYLRDKIWNAYRVGQEVTMTPSREYVVVAREVEAWIERYLDNKHAADDARSDGWRR